jgi:hypothetical protein
MKWLAHPKAWRPEKHHCSCEIAVTQYYTNIGAEPAAMQNRIKHVKLTFHHILSQFFSWYELAGILAVMAKHPRSLWLRQAHLTWRTTMHEKLFICFSPAYM